MPEVTLNALAPTVDINSFIGFVNAQGGGMVNPEIFYSKQLLDTIRLDAGQYVYYKLADTAPIENKADKLMIRRWSPLQAHTVPLVEGIPPKSDKGSVEKYELQANQYGRYMEFTDKVDLKVVDPVIAHYSREYSLVALETLDLLARETLFSLANPHYAGQAANFEALTVTSKPTLEDLRLIVLSLTKNLVKPRSNGNFQVIVSADFSYAMVTDALVEKYMGFNQTTGGVYSSGKPMSLFGMEFVETMVAPTNADFIKLAEDGITPLKAKRMYRDNGAGGYEYATILETDLVGAPGTAAVYSVADGYVKDSRTGLDASYIPGQGVWDLETWNTNHKLAGADWYEFKVLHALIVGKDALTRTGISGQDSARMIVKGPGSSGVVDPIDQRQSIGFKINSVGFGSTRLEAIADYMCVPATILSV